MNNRKTVVISQPMYFPWVGIFEQIKHSDIFVFFDDIQFSRGFINRVQYKTPDGSKWLTVPLEKHPRDTNISQLNIQNSSDWKRKHLRSLEITFNGAKYADDALDIASNIFSMNYDLLSDMLIESIHQVRNYFDIGNSVQYYKSSELEKSGAKGDLIKDIILGLGANRYITGHGALNYLDHEDLEQCGIDVQYINYEMKKYPQKFGTFTPFVTILDLIANCGNEGKKYICSQTINWRDISQNVKR